MRVSVKMVMNSGALLAIGTNMAAIKRLVKCVSFDVPAMLSRSKCVQRTMPIAAAKSTVMLAHVLAFDSLSSLLMLESGSNKSWCVPSWKYRKSMYKRRRTIDEPREKVRIFSAVSVEPESEKVEYRAVGRIKATAAIVMMEESASVMALLKVTVRLLE
jgi:hypothetical protein